MANTVFNIGKRADLLGIIAAITSISTVGIGLSLSLPLLALVLEARGVSGTGIGINTAMSGVAAIIVVPFVTPLARRFGTALLIAVLIVAAAIGFIGFYLIESYWVWFPLRFVFSGAITGIFILSEFWISACAPAKKRGFILGIYGTALSIGFAIGPIVLSVVGWQGPLPFIVGMIIFAVSLIPVIVARNASPQIERKPAERFSKFLFAVPLATFAAFAFGAVESGVMPMLPIYGLHIGMTTEIAILLVTVMTLGNVILQIPLGIMSDRMDRRILLLICAVVGVICSALIPVLANHSGALYLNLFIWGGFTGGLYTVGLTHLAARYSDADLAAANAAFVMMYSFGMLIGPSAMGIGIDVWDPHGFAVVCTAFFGGYASLAAVRIYKTRNH